MSDKDESTDIWEHPLTDQTFRPADNGMVIEPGKSNLEVTDDTSSFDKLDRIRLEQLKLQQTEAEEEIQYQIKRLELERQRSRVKFEKELARLKSVDSGEYYRVDEEVKIRSTLNSGMDFTSLNDMLCKLDLPKIELPYFDGDSSEYHYFIREFETQIESRVKSNSQRLSYLLHYCRGRAKRAISGCVMLSGPEGYSNARSILSNMFGRPHVVAKSLLDKITSGKPVKSSSDDLWELSIEMQNCQTTLSQMSYTSDLNSHLTIERVARRLPFDLQRRWVERASEIYDENREPLFRDLIEFVVKRARVAGCRYNDMLTTRDEYKVNASNRVGQRPKDKIPKSMVTFNSNITKMRDICPLCKLEHALDKCPVFSSMSVSNRWRYILRCKRCLLCLLPDHMASDCKQSERCGQHGCNESHHSMLHRNKNESSHSVNAAENIAETSDSPERVSLGIIAVNVIGPKDCRLTYALIDNGSDSTFISRALADTLGITGEEASVTVRTLNSVNTERSTKVSFIVESIDTCEQVKVDQAFTIARLNLGYGYPLSSKQLEQWKHLTDVKLNDLGQREIELLIGCNTPEVHWSIEQRIGNKHQPFAVKSVLGWTLFGPLGSDRSSDKSLCLLSVNNSIDEQLIKLYNKEFEDIDDHCSLSVEDSDAIRQVTNSVSLENGHFVVGLPWKIDKSNLPDNITVARRRLSQLKRRFELNTDLFEKYKTLIQRHFDLGYATSVSTASLNANVRWYLPHHPVLNAKKPGKVRIVFDCAAKYMGVCLNDHLLQGPNMVQNLVAVLTRFRNGTFALTGDIQEMFLQVKVPDADKNVLRFLWWDEGDYSKPVKEYQLTVHPFGAVSSPFCASFALQKCIDLYDGIHKHRIASILRDNFYVDDCLFSCDSETELSELRSELSNLLHLAGFHLTKWTSNSKTVLESIPCADYASSIVNLSLHGLPVERTLGLQWNSQSDCFIFDVHLPDRPFTRRGMLSCVSSLYDPLGLVCPILLPAKQMLQELCRSKMGWDDLVDEKTTQSWKHWLCSIESLRDLKIRRCFRPPDVNTDSQPELHLFSDASEKGYGIAAYVRYAVGDDTFQCSLLFGKSRVSPLKSVSIPRLELTAAVLAVRVANLISRERLIQPSKTYYWTDSMTVLYYLANTSSRFATFVANRVSFILEHSSQQQWMHVKGSENPADYASRGLFPADDRFMLWLNGPLFLRTPFKNREAPKLSVVPEGCELKRAYSARVNNMPSCLHKLLAHYSSWSKLQRAVVWLTRFKTYLTVVHNLRPDSFVRLGLINMEEIKQAVSDIITVVQNESFASERDELMKHGKCTRLAKLNPSMHNSILTLGGRLGGARSSQLDIRPILPSNHVVTGLIIRYYHELEGHAGLQQVLSTVRKHFWIVKGASAVKRVLNNCARCKRLNAQPLQQQMARLPECRITPGTYAFDSCGVDYFGPLFVQQGRSVMKRWGCLFTCMRSRAVHIEIVHTLSTDSFLMALIRFINRRGHPKEIFSDNGSNFVGADAELKKELALLSQEKISSSLLARGIQWHFNPPGSSHRGGAWERLIRSTRKILRAISNEQILRDEVLLTAMTEVERILNNRPLVPVYDDARDALALSPNDLILLRPIEPVINDASIDLRRYTKWWKQAWHLSNIFWKRWVRDYLPTLELQQKWLHPKRNLKVGDIVLVVSDVGSKDDWPLGRVVATYPSEDGLVRKVDVITKRGKFQRDIRRLCFLEGDS